MAVKERDWLRKAQAELEPKDDLTPYVGRWVALRAGHVVASDLDAKALRAHTNVWESDVIIPVSRSHGGYFVA
jgi:predicted phage gp36 major capsid-like protein